MIPLCILAIENDDDRAYMTQLYLQYQRLMFSTINKILCDQWLTEDVMQSTIIKLIGKISLLKELDRKHTINYIITACKNTAFNVKRHQSRHPEWSFDADLDDVQQADDYLDVENQIIAKDELKQLSGVWPLLDEKSQYLLEARYILDKDLQEISTGLGIKPQSVRMALTRARKKAYLLMSKNNQPV